jgi:hypothetical protein
MRAIRTVLLTTAMTACLAPAAAGQGVGVKAGATRTEVSFDDPAPITGSPQVGVLAGGFATFGLWSRFSAQVEALFAQRTSDFEGLFTDRLRYLEVPVLVRYRVWSRGRIDLHALAGANIAFLLSATESISGSEADISDAIRSRDVAAVGGVGIAWGRLGADVRYLHGLSKLYPSQAAPAPEFRAYQRGIEITAGWRLF